eukprot:361839-Chlamydomonas_euryale.AAC.1
MVGDDQATAAFRDFWLTTAVPRGGVLVYNTGRALPSFLELLEEKVRFGRSACGCVGKGVCE